MIMIMSHTENKSKIISSRIALNGVFLCVALILSYIESLIPLNFIVPLPGFKLGFANISIMFVFVYLGVFDAAEISFLRVLIISILFGSVTSFAFSLSGAVLSFVSLLILRKLRFKNISWIGVSVICAVSHNIGQIIAASVVFASITVISYLPWLLIMGTVCGIITGVIMHLVSSNKNLKKIYFNLSI